MLRRLIFPLLLGITGTAILLWLGTWQVQRLSWKAGVLEDLQARISAPAVDLPEIPSKADHQYLSVETIGEVGTKEVLVLASTKEVGAIYRVIVPFRTMDGRRILVDRGYVLDELKDSPRPIGVGTIAGNLVWPDEVDSYTPEPDLNAGIWFARDLPKLAEHLNTEPVLLVVRKTTLTGSALTPLPVDTAGIPNKHLEYAVTWYGLALVWVLMTGLMIWRQTRKHEG